MSSQKWGIPLLSLSTYLRFWSAICFCVTFWLTFFQKEVRIYLVHVHTIDQPSHQRKEVLRDEDTSITGVYKTIWSILKLKRKPSGTLNPRLLLTFSRCPMCPCYAPVR